MTDMTRTFHHRPFRLEDHIDRFYRSARYTRIRPPFDRDRMEEISRELVRHNAKFLPPGRELSMVHFMTAGEIASYSALPGTPKEMVPTLCIHTFPVPFEAFTHLFTEGAHVVTPSIRHYPPQCVDSKIKHRSRMHQWLADQETHQVDPRAITLLLDLDGNVTETSGSNFAIVQGRWGRRPFGSQHPTGSQFVNRFRTLRGTGNSFRTAGFPSLRCDEC